MPVTKPRVIAGTLRPVGRDMYEARREAHVPSATGGAPAQSAGRELAAATGNLLPEMELPRPGEVAAMRDLVARYGIRMRNDGVISRLPLLNRSIQEYTQNNEALVNLTKTYLDRLQAQGTDVLRGVFADTDQMARWAVAVIARSFEPGPIPPVPDFIYQSRAGRRLAAITEAIREANDAGA